MCRVTAITIMPSLLSGAPTACYPNFKPWTLSPKRCSFCCRQAKGKGKRKGKNGRGDAAEGSSLDVLRLRVPNCKATDSRANNSDWSPSSGPHRSYTSQAPSRETRPLTPELLMPRGLPRNSKPGILTQKPESLSPSLFQDGQGMLHLMVWMICLTRSETRSLTVSLHHVILSYVV